MAASSPMKKTIELHANTSTPRGATIRLTVEYQIRPSTPTHPGPREALSMTRTVDVDMGANGKHTEKSTYRQANETDNSNYNSTSRQHLSTERTPIPKQAYIKPFLSTDTVLVPETVVEHISEDEKSTSSEEVVFEEWSEEFKCRRTDEYDRNTNKLLRTTIDETSDRVKGDVVKEEYKEKHVRIKGHKSYDIIKEVYRRVPANTVDSTIVPIDRSHTHVYEKIPQPPHSTKSTTSSSVIEKLYPPNKDRHWSAEDIYTTEIVYDSNLARDIESTALAERVEPKFDTSTPPSFTNYDRVRPGQYPPMSPTTQAIISTIPSLSHYDRISTIVTPTLHYADKRKKEHEEFISEEYHVEVDQHTKGKNQEEETSDDYTTTGGRRSSTRGDSDWRKKLTQIYAPPSDDDRSDQSDRSKIISTSATDDDRPQPPKRSSPFSSSVDEYRTKFEQQKQIETTTKTDRPSFGRVGELKSAFETNGSVKDDSSKYKTSITTDLTDQRRRLFEEQEWTSTTRRPVTEFHSDERRMSETHTAPSRVTDRISRVESTESKSTSRIQPTDRLGRTGFDAVKSALESSMAQATPQTSIDIKIKNKQTMSSIDSDLSGASPPVYQSTPKSTKAKHDNDDAGHESEDELSDPIVTNKQGDNYDARRRTPKTRLRDFSQSTSQTIDTSHTAQRTTSRFNETNMENILSHVPTSKGKGLLIELSPRISQSPTKAIHDPNKSIITSDSGVFDYSTTTSQHLPNTSSSWRNNASTSITDDATRTRDNDIYIDSATTTSSNYGRRQTSDTDQTKTKNADDSLSRSTYKYDPEILSGEPINQQQRTVRRQIISSPPTDYESLSNYRSGINSQGKVPITTQSRTIKPLVVDEIETIETETHIECQVQRTNEKKESITKTERTISPISSPQKITTTTSRSQYNSSDEKTPTKRVLLNERTQYYESTKIPKQEEPARGEEPWFKPIEHDRSEENVRYSPTSSSNIRPLSAGPRTMEVTSLSPQNQVTFGKHSPSEIIAIVRVPELASGAGVKASSPTATSSSTMRHGASEAELYSRDKQEEDRSRLHYQRVHATSYRPPPISQYYQQRQTRSRADPLETTNDHSSPISFPTRSASYHSALHEQNQQQQRQDPYSPNTRLTYRPPTQHHTGSLGNLFGSNLQFEIEIEKRPPHRPEQPTVVSLDQASRAIITTSKDGRVSIQNVAARPGNTVVINSDFHSSDRSLNRSSGYFSSDEFRSQGVNTNYSSDEQSSSANPNSQSAYSQARGISKLPSYYRPQQSSQKTNDHFDQANEIIHRYYQPSNTTTGFNEAINQIDALYNNLDIQTNNQTTPYDFSKSTSTLNRRKQLAQNSNEYSKRYTSTGFQQIPYEQQQPTTNLDFQTNDSHRTLSDQENVTNNNNNNRHWGYSSLTNLVMNTPIRPSQSLASSGILADYATPGSVSPNSGYGSTQNIIQHQNRLNAQSQIVQRNRTSVKQVKQKNAAKKRNGNIQGQYSDEDDDNDSPLSDNGNQQPSGSYNFTNRHQ